MTFRHLLAGAAVSAITLAAVAPAMAQQTASTLRGSVTDAAGAPIAGATVTITDSRTNSRSTAVTSTTGNFVQTGLRVGGPYSVEVDAAGFAGQELNIGSLTIGSNDPIFVSLDASDTTTVVVTGARVATIDIANGAGTVFSAEDIQDAPMLDRDLTSVLELDPLVSVTGSAGEPGVISFAGIEPRLNGFVVDGALIGDKFKLEEAFYPSLRQPISLDVLEAAAATFSEYSVLTTGAQGGLVNTVTKTGSNEIDGTVYYRFGNDSLFGVHPYDQFSQALDDSELSEDDYGFTLSGPIIKDKLFFVVNYEEFERSEPIVFDELGASELAAFETVRQAFLTATDGSGNLRYEGFDPGVKTNSALNELTSERLFAKLDWQINDNHRASAWYLKLEDGRLQNVGGLTYLFPTSYYDKTTEIDLYHTQLVSNWSDNLTTTVRFISKEQVTGQDARGDTSATGTQYPTFVVEDVPGLNDSVQLGPDPFRQANAFEDEQWQLFGAADYVWNNHIFTVGAEYQDYELFNLFGQYCRGAYTFATVQDVLDGNAELQYQNVPGNECLDRTAAWGYQKLDLFAQDEWQIHPDLSVNFGIRYERFSSDDTPPVQGNFAAEYGANSVGDIDGLDIIQPRFGFAWDAPYDVAVSGGVGLFSGGDPVVWFSNAYSPLPTQVFLDVVDYSGFNTVPAAAEAAVDLNTGPFNYDTIDPNFEIPSLWKASLKAERAFDLGRFGDDYNVGVQLVYSKVKDTTAFINRAQIAGEIADPTLAATVAGRTGVAPDGRPIYPDARSTGDSIVLTNSDEGESFAASIALEKEFDLGLTLYGSYTFTESDRVYPGSSSRHISNYRSLVTTDRNSAGPAGTSVFEVEDRFVFQGKYEREFIDGLESQFVLKGIIESGPVSNVGYINFLDSRTRIFGRAAGGSPFGGVDQLYIPLLNAQGNGFDDPRVIFSSASNEARFLAEVSELGLLGSAGGFTEKNGIRGPWNQRWDFGFSQELPGIPGAEQFVGDNQLKFTLDIFNVANLLNDEWGTQVNDPRFDALSVVEAYLVSAADAEAFRNGTLTNISSAYIGSNHGAACPTQDSCVYVYNRVFSNDTFTRDIENSVWKARIGLRYEF